MLNIVETAHINIFNSVCSDITDPGSQRTIPVSVIYNTNLPNIFHC